MREGRWQEESREKSVKRELWEKIKSSKNNRGNESWEEKSNEEKRKKEERQAEKRSGRVKGKKKGARDTGE